MRGCQEKGGMIREEGKGRGVCCSVTEWGGERNWTDLLYGRSCVRCRAGKSSEQHRELCSSPFILQLKVLSAAAAGELSHFPLSLLKSEHFGTLETEEKCCSLEIVRM